MQSLRLKLAKHCMAKTAPLRHGYASVQQRWTVRTLQYLLKLLLMMGCSVSVAEGLVFHIVQTCLASIFAAAAE